MSGLLPFFKKFSLNCIKQVKMSADPLSGCVGQKAAMDFYRRCSHPQLVATNKDCEVVFEKKEDETPTVVTVTWLDDTTMELDPVKLNNFEMMNEIWLEAREKQRRGLTPTMPDRI
jgi:hypothetical protein